ncbi:MAG TPA: cation:proton antiporter, partial [candidate division Zixibacteria bacterium]|nr:cation:proton antiporter [candidate division Zixibacteria bacterium]
MELVYLKDIVIILALAVAIVALFTRLRVPTIAGFIAAGMVVGPQGLALVSDPHQVQFLAEIGVTLLLFAIGLELPLEHLRRLWKAVLIGGGLQVGATIALCVLVGRAFDLSWGQAIFVGCVVAVSSTAIVLRGLEQRGEIDAPHGRFTLGILLFQDMCVAPMILIIPTLSGGDVPGAGLAGALLRAALIIGAAILAGKYLVPRIMDIVARTRQRQLFIMTALLFCVGTAWVTASAGITLALGAFLAGVIVGGSQYRHQTLSDIIPFREVFISLFFVSIGMLLDVREIVESLAPIATLLIGILALKFTIVFLTGLALRAPLRVSVMSATALAQVGEFSFVLLGAGAAVSLIGEDLNTQLTVAIALSMLLTPLLLSLAPRFAAGVGRLGFLTPAFAGEESTAGSVTTVSLNNHIIIGGYGLAGADLARGLRDCGEPYIIVDLNPDNVRLAH